MAEASSDREPLEQLAESFLARFRSGERPSLTELTAAHPDLADQIQALFPALIEMEQAGSEIDEAKRAAESSGLLGARPQSLGDYRIIREIGRGGMGIVYEAEQVALGRRVALKVLPAGLAGDARARARFDREARAAARLHHTNIVPVFDVGEDEGQAFYAMQMIRGQGLDLVIDELKRLRKESPGPQARAATSIAGSLLLGRFVPENLAGTDPGSPAHARGVIHRDIKPSNLLLDTAGIIWVTDFGLAKTGDLAMTATGDIVGTIRYMAPERFRGQCDGRADMYALGLTLYELLTLKPAFNAADRMELIEQIRRDEPSSPRSVDRKVPRDLETIVLKAIDKDPRRRYQSGDELGEDLERFLADQPVRARRIWLPERLGRWVRRNPAVAGLTAAVFLAMAAGTVVSSWQATRARAAEGAATKSAAAEKQQRAAAEEQEAETRAVLEFVENKVFAAARPEGQEGGLGREVTLRKALEASLPHVAESFKTQPPVEAGLRNTLGLSFGYLGEPRIAQEQFEAALAVQTKHRGPTHPGTLKIAHNLANVYAELGRLEDARKLREEVLVLRKATLGLDHPDTLKGMNNLADSYLALGRHADALKLYEETLLLEQAKLGADHPETLRGMIGVASSYYAMGRYPDALKIYEDALALRKVKLGPEHPDTLISMSSVAASYLTLGRHTEAVKLNEEILARLRAKLGSDHHHTFATMNNLTISYLALGRHTEAAKLNEELVERRKVKLGPDHPDTLGSMNNLAVSYYTLGRYAQALELREETLRRLKAKLGIDHPYTLFAMKNLAESYDTAGRRAKALKLREETLSLRKARLGPDHPDTLRSQMNVANSMLGLGRADDAAALARQTAELWENSKRTDGESRYQAACSWAIAAAAVRAGGKSAQAAGTPEADRAMADLEQAVAAGFDAASQMTGDADLDALRDRADFKALVDKLKSATKD
jgi:tetratricopeptide (TPR) repeat protein